MFRKLTLAAAAGAGYVLGAKAGKERYNQIEAKFREIAGMPAVQNATNTVVESASSLADQAKSTASDKVGGSSSGGASSGGASSSGSSSSMPGGSSVADADVVVVDLGTGANTGATSPTGGARPSDSV